jgi:DNA recombination protein RmuC
MNPIIAVLIGFGAGGLIAAVVFLVTRSRETAEEVLIKKIEILGDVQEREERMLREEMGRARQENAHAAKVQREELRAALMGFTETFATQTGKLTESNEHRLENLRSTVDLRLKQLQDDNSKHLEKVRQTVDEKLQGTLEKRLGESFKQVSDGLARVFEVSGEMKTLAMGVGDLKRVLSNVTARGNWGEVQLEKLLEQILTPEQYERRVRVNPDTAEVVDFAIRLPGNKGNGNGRANGDVVWLPIDAKFPTEDYQRLVEAQEKGDVDAAEAASKALSNRLRDSAKDICAKYIRPPKTTDFGIMFLPTEGLYAEMLRRRGLFETVQRECRVMIAGPMTLWAVLNSLQMGFRSLTIQKRSSEVWQLLSTIKAEFGKFGDLLDGVKKKLDQASSTMEDAARKSRTIEKKLRKVEELPPAEAKVLLRDLIPEAQSDD